jgi:CTD small phosphatase-like protein 2
METQKGYFIKDLRIIKNRELKDMVIVDNLVLNFGLQIDNGIPILEFTDNPNDQELKHLEGYLNDLVKAKDTRQHNIEQL